MDPKAGPRSQFVTGLAWAFIALSGFTTFIAAMQNLIVHLMFRGEMREAMRNAPVPAGFGAAAFLAQHIEWFFLGFLLVSALTLAVSIGLLRRHEWARRTFIGLMGFGIAWQLFGLAMQFVMMPSFQASLADAPAGFADGFRTMTLMIRVVSGVMALGVCALLGWIIKRLLAADVRAEFGSHPSG